MTAALVVIRFITRLQRDCHIEFHLVSPADVEIQPVIPKLTQDDVITFMKSFPTVCQRYPFSAISETGVGFEKVEAHVHCEAQLMGLIDLKIRQGPGLNAKVSRILPVVLPHSRAFYPLNSLRCRTVLIIYLLGLGRNAASCATSLHRAWQGQTVTAHLSLSPAPMVLSIPGLRLLTSKLVLSNSFTPSYIIISSAILLLRFPIPHPPLLWQAR